MAKVKACLTSQVPPGAMITTTIMGRTILIANVDGTYYAIDGLCSHGGASLAHGVLNGFIVKCPLHGASFDLRTGKLVQLPWTTDTQATDLRAYPVTEEEDCVIVDL